MSIYVIKNLFIIISFAIVLFLSASLFYIKKSDYLNVEAIVEQSKCVPVKNSKLYFCTLDVTYLIDGNKISNQLVINSNIIYKQSDNITLECDSNNYLNVSVKTKYKEIALCSCLFALIFLLYSIVIFNDIKQEIMDKVNNISSYISIFT
jgi:hypothetical protein